MTTLLSSLPPETLVIMDRVGVCAIRNDSKLLAEITAREPWIGRALDLGTGTGYVGLYLAQRGWQVDAVDISPRALALARANAKRNGLSMTIYQSNLFDQTKGPYDAIAFNPPMWPHETEFSRLFTNTMRSSNSLSNFLMNSIGRLFENYRKKFLRRVVLRAFEQLRPQGRLILAISGEEVVALSECSDVKLVEIHPVQGAPRQQVAVFKRR